MFKVMKSRHLQPRSLYPAMLLFRMEGQIKNKGFHIAPEQYIYFNYRHLNSYIAYLFLIFQNMFLWKYHPINLLDIYKIPNHQKYTLSSTHGMFTKIQHIRCQKIYFNKFKIIKIIQCKLPNNKKLNHTPITKIYLKISEIIENLKSCQKSN